MSEKDHDIEDCTPECFDPSKAIHIPAKVRFTDDDLKRWDKSFEKTKTCWNWKAVIGSNGYGRFWAQKKLWLAHRFAFILIHKEIPSRLVIDHVCRNRLCVNPDHWRTMTSKENTLNGIGITAVRLRRNACTKGHAWDERSIEINPKTNGRQCRICRVAKHSEYLKQNTETIKATRKRRWALRAV